MSRIPTKIGALALSLIVLPLVYADELEATVKRIAALEVDSDYGEYLAGECLTCHGDVEAEGVPKIAGADKLHLITELFKFQTGTRVNPTMTSIANALGEDEIASLAEYFSKLVDQ